MQLRDCKPGMRLRLIDKAGGAADVGAIAVVAETSSYDDKYVNVNWDRTNGLDHGQMNGQYRPESFEEIKPMQSLRKGDKFTMEFEVVSSNPGSDTLSALNVGCRQVNYFYKEDVTKGASSIIRAPVPLAAGQVWVDKKVGYTRTIVFVDDKSVLYDYVNTKGHENRGCATLDTFKRMTKGGYYTLQDS